MEAPRKIFVASTRQNDGKTVVSIGLVRALRRRFSKVGFIKPVGQKYVMVEGEKVDKDALLMKKVCGLDDDVRDMSPIAVDETFTRKYLESPDQKRLLGIIRASYERIADGKDVVVVEGTGHAGVGSVFDLSNAQVARFLRTPVALITIGGIGRPIDEIALNAALFEQCEVPITGVIVNKLLAEKKVQAMRWLRRGFERTGRVLLGAIPYVPVLSRPTIGQICEAVRGRMISGEGKSDKKVTHIIVGAMTPRHSLDYFKPESLLITPGDREDLILAALSQRSMTESGEELMCGLVLTGGLSPHRAILELIRKAELPTVMVHEGTYEVASQVHELVVKVRAEDIEKIELAERLVEEHVAIDRMLDLSAAGGF